ncbi:hypothetical protein GBAR_LOCUS170 [Geodia barretti]|uniref:SRCR domain-containing protein n=1 Tax=Geodia barretti TaxID=519541 RepID=A0AA35QS80_GEOBA|nr:hypothetical protein GBAR_LOCUS170 [Geodia barretti]
MRSHVWSLLAALLRVLLVRGAGPEDPSPECGDEDVRLLTAADNNAISAALDGVLGDVHGSLEICENEIWKKVVLCLNGNGEELWTTENTAVACRELGYPAPGESGGYDIQSTESSRRLPYIPQCMGSEERLEDCSTLNHAGNCDAPLLISCWNSSSDTSVIILMTSTLVSSVKLLVSPASTQTLTPYYSVKQSSSIMYYVLETKPPSELLSSPHTTHWSQYQW